MSRKIARALGALQLFVGLGALPVGLNLVLWPDGSGIGLPLDLLKDSPFPDFFIPGLVLFAVNGLCNLIAAVITFRRRRRAGVIGIFLGIFLALWILIQAYLIGWVTWLQPLYLAIGLVEILLSVRLWPSSATAK